MKMLKLYRKSRFFNERLFGGAFFHPVGGRPLVIGKKQVILKV